MARIVVFNNVTLDGVMQAPGRPDEDRRGDFEHGGWGQPYAESVFAVIADRAATPKPLLLGRRTYEDFASVWPHMPDDIPYTSVINNCRKYVASTTLSEPLEWNNSVPLTGDLATAVAKLKEQENEDITVLGSGELVQSLMRDGLVDEYVLLIHPLVLGSGRHHFPAGSPLTTFELVDSVTTTTGVIIATYRPVGQAVASSSDGRNTQ
jgi:dihydrofolate reductase